MANLKHVTPRYIVDRLSVVLDEKRHPNHPWLTKDSVELLGQLLRKQDVGVEFGSGRSTHWFLSKIASITSIETHEGWFKKVSQDCESEISSKRMVYHLASDVESFLTIIDGFDSDSIDFCLVDGSHRDTCALSMVPKIKTGGLMVVDNINWYIFLRKFDIAERTPHRGWLCQREMGRVCPDYQGLALYLDIKRCQRHRHLDSYLKYGIPQGFSAKEAAPALRTLHWH